MSVVIYHNPRCSKSRETLELIRGRGIEPTVIEYLKTPPSPRELKSLLARLGMKPRELMRRKEPAYKELGLDAASLSEDALIRAMVENPVLIERPIVVKGERVALGRPPEAALKIL